MTGYRIRPTSAGCWVATCDGCGAISIAYPLHSAARQWVAEHRCPEHMPGEAA